MRPITRRCRALRFSAALLSLAVVAFASDGAAAKSRRPHPIDASTGFGPLPHIAPIPLSDPAATPVVTAPARFFTINKVLAKLDGAAPPSGAVRLATRDPGSATDGRARLDAVNRAVNGAIRYMTDREQFGVEDLWSSPLASFRTGFGDCEDYAIAKYVALREAGVAAADLRIVLARDIAVREDHAVLAARLDGRWLILDNRRADLLDDGAVRNLMPLFAIGQQGVQMFAAPYVERTIGREGADLAPATADPMFGTGGAGMRPVLM